MEHILELQGVRKEFVGAQGAIVALDNLSVTLKKGESLAIVGPSGSGKTTLLQLVGGLDVPSKGKVTVAGQDLSALSDTALAKFRNKTIGFIFQFFNLQGYFTAQENVAFPLILGGMSTKQASEKAAKLLKQVGLQDRLDHVPAQMSGGEMQRVAVARALAQDPQLLLADEPTANLDAENAARVVELLHAVAKSGTTLVVITHDSALAKQFQHTLHLSKGKAVA
jgi:ABC-type lipoprotein export system ATPase subunit